MTEALIGKCMSNDNKHEKDECTYCCKKGLLKE